MNTVVLKRGLWSQAAPDRHLAIRAAGYSSRGRSQAQSHPPTARSKFQSAYRTEDLCVSSMRNLTPLGTSAQRTVRLSGALIVRRHPNSRLPASETKRFAPSGL